MKLSQATMLFSITVVITTALQATTIKKWDLPKGDLEPGIASVYDHGTLQVVDVAEYEERMGPKLLELSREENIPLSPIPFLRLNEFLMRATGDSFVAQDKAKILRNANFAATFGLIDCVGLAVRWRSTTTGTWHLALGHISANKPELARILIDRVIFAQDFDRDSAIVYLTAAHYTSLLRDVYTLVKASGFAVQKNIQDVYFDIDTGAKYLNLSSTKFSELLIQRMTLEQVARAFNFTAPFTMIFGDNFEPITMLKVDNTPIAENEASEHLRRYHLFLKDSSSK